MRLLLLKTALILLFTASASAQDAPEPPQIPPGEDQIEHLERGERAPYEGMLLSIDTAIRWTHQLQWWPEAFKLRLQEHEEILAAERNSFQLRLNILDESRTREILGLRGDIREQGERFRKRIAQLEDPPFWKTGWFGFICGVVLVGAAITVGALVIPD